MNFTEIDREEIRSQVCLCLFVDFGLFIKIITVGLMIQNYTVVSVCEKQLPVFFF